MKPALYAAIEAGGTKFVCALGDAQGRLLERIRIPTRDPASTLASTCEWLHAASTRLGNLHAIGVGSFGPVELDVASPRYGQLLRTPKVGWSDTDLLAPLAQFRVPMALDTDVNAAALAECRWGAGRDVDHLVYVTVGTGIGGGGVIGGRLLHGLLHPEMGHLPVRRDAVDDYAGTCSYHRDCLEGMASGPAIAERWGTPGQYLTGRQLAEAVRLEAGYLAQMAASMTYLLSPERLIFGGGVMHLDGLLDALRERTVELLNGYIDVAEITEHTDRYIVRPQLGDHAGLLGAIALAADAAH